MNLLASLTTWMGYTNKEVVVHETKTMKVIVPVKQLGAGSVQILPKTGSISYAEWSDENRKEAYELAQKIDQVWKKNKIHNHYVYGLEDASSKKAFNWEIIPYDTYLPYFWKRMRVLWNVEVGALPSTQKTREVVAAQLKKGLSELDAKKEVDVKEAEAKIVKTEGPDFCDPKILDTQRVFKGKLVDILYNFKPLAHHHFLIIPKEHRERFTGLTAGEHAESTLLSQKLIKHFKEKGYNIADIFSGSGKGAGVTVPHTHLHVVLTANKVERKSGICNVWKKMFCNVKALSKEELAKRVNDFSAELAKLA